MRDKWEINTIIDRVKKVDLMDMKYKEVFIVSKKLIGIVLSLSIIIGIVGIFYYNNTFARSIAVATVTEKGNGFIMI